MIVGVGIDLVEVARIKRSIERFGDRFARRILHADEIRTLETEKLAPYIARQFAGKEAVSKTLGTGMRAGVSFRNIVILRNEAGAPIVVLKDGAEKIAAQLGIAKIHISLSDERDYAMAYAIAEGEL